MKAVYLFGISLLLSSLGLTVAQQHVITSEYAYRHYTTQDGLPNLYLTSIYQDSKGFIWIGSRSGMSRYDGFTFKNYMTPDASAIFSIRENSERELVGIDYYSRFTLSNRTENIRTDPFGNKWEYEKSLSRSLEPDGGIFACYPDEGPSSTALFEFKDDSLKKVFEHDSLTVRKNYANAVYRDRKAKLIYLPNFSGVSVVSESGQLKAYWKGEFIFYFTPRGNELFAVGSKGIYKVSGTDFRLIFPHDFSNNNIVQMVVHQNDLIIKGDFIVWRFSHGKLEQIFSLPSPLIKLFVDRENNVWLVTTNGLYLFFQLNFRNYSFHNIDDNFRTVLFDKAGLLWIGTQKGKVFLMDKNGVTRPFPFQPKNSYYSQSQFFHANGSYDRFTNTLYFPSGNGVLQVTDGKPRWMTVPDDNYNNVKCISAGRNLIGQGFGFYITDSKGSVIKGVLTKDHLLNDVNDFEEDNNGDIWVFGSKGVTILKEGSRKTMTDSLFRKSYVSTKDTDGHVWFSAGSKLFKAENDTAKLFFTFQSPIIGLMVYDQSQMIVSSLTGFYLFNYQTNNYNFYDYQNGFTGLQPTTTPVLKDSEGKVWINSAKYLISFDIKSIIKKPVNLNLQIESVENSSDNVHWARIDHSADSFRYNVNSFKFKYIGLLYSSSTNVRYQYRLVGFQDEWSQPISEREVTFNKLNPGHYTFELKANAGTSDTQTATVSFPIFIKPAFWQTLLFKIVMLFSLGGLIAWMAIRYQRRKHGRELRKISREKEMNELRVQSVRLKSIPHFNSNVLAGIEYFIMTRSKEEANDLLTIYSRFTNITLHDIDKAQRSLREELEYVRMYLELEKMRYGDKLSFSMDVDENVNDGIMIPNMVLHSFAENAIKHGVRGKNSPGSVWIKVVGQNKGILLSVEDDGVGRPESARRNAKLNRQGQGLGILSRQIELYNQQNEEKITQTVIDLVNAEGVAIGTRFEMYVPYEYKYI